MHSKRPVQRNNLFGSDHVGVLGSNLEGRLNSYLGRSVHGHERVVIVETNFLARIWSRDPTPFERGGGERLCEGGISVRRRWWADIIKDSEYRELWLWCVDRRGIGLG